MNAEIITLVLRLAMCVMVGIVVPAFKKWLEAKTENEKYAQLQKAAETAVYAAEQMCKAANQLDPEGTERKKIAKHAISRAAIRLGLAITDQEIEEILEAAVQEINLMKYGAVTVPAEDDA